MLMLVPAIETVLSRGNKFLKNPPRMLIISMATLKRTVKMRVYRWETWLLLDLSN
jgi:hypothetical protein